MLEYALLAICELYLYSLDTDARSLSTFGADRRRNFDAHARDLSTHRTFSRWIYYACAWTVPTTFTRLWVQWSSFPVIIIEVFICLYKVINGEVILVVEQAGASAYDLFELDH